MKRPNVSGSLYRLIYCSRNALDQACWDAADAPMRAILASSRRHNHEDNITGALLLTVSGFAQVLEGPREAVERTFERINSDPRHADVTVISFTPTERRSFPDWPMGFFAQSEVDSADPLVLLLADTISGGPRGTRGSDVLRLLEAMVKREDSSPAACSSGSAAGDLSA